MHPMLTIATRAAHSAATIAAQAFEQRDRLKIAEKSPNNYVSDIDILLEQTIIETIKTAFPEHQIIAEESAEQSAEESAEQNSHPNKEKNTSEYCWIIDPIDGTTNFIKGNPHFAISIAVYKNGKPEAALVYSPITDEMFCAARGQGATLNDRKIRASKALPENAIVATGIPFKSPEIMPQATTKLKNVLNEFPDIRRSGSAALDLCYVACGRFDAYYELGLSQWDIAAGVLIAQESGAIVSDINGELTHMQSGNIIAAPAKIYKSLIKSVKPR